MRRQIVLGPAFLVVAWSAGDAAAREPRRQAYTVRIEAFVASAPADVPTEAVWTVSLRGRSYDLHVTRLQVLTGNIAYYDIVRTLRPYRPAFVVTGDDHQLALLASAPAGRKVSVLGVLRFGSGARHLLVSRVEHIGQATPAAAPTPTP